MTCWSWRKTIISFRIFDVLLFMYCSTGATVLALRIKNPSAEIFIGLIVLFANLGWIMISTLMIIIGNPGYIPSDCQRYMIPADKKFKPSRYIDKTDLEKARIHNCLYCRVMQPPKTSHCSVCNKCVQFRYIHLNIIKKCVGLYNIKLYFIFLVNGLICSGMCIILSYTIMMNVITPFINLNFVFIFMISVIYLVRFIYEVWNLMIFMADRKIPPINDAYNIFRTDSWYKSFKFVLGKVYLWLIPIKISKKMDYTVPVRLRTSFGTTIKVKNKYVIN
ncbi:unnamed protein product [Blepharisma stoltei]|uniref:Palmitoyltransferase n=1 Tax=Blepharisma stoltei TaxID=1481888 RepID=A0AAU9JPQ8_9CILI|nr:unnamed protein product [Blepharisma stoltei]